MLLLLFVCLQVEELESDNSRLKIEIESGKEEKRKKVRPVKKKKVKISRSWVGRPVVHMHVTCCPVILLIWIAVQSAESAALPEHQPWPLGSSGRGASPGGNPRGGGSCSQGQLQHSEEHDWERASQLWSQSTTGELGGFKFINQS